ncbi:hypothetical protein FMEAI12_2260013 [Parafrankia sp. Ea1.12]|nr:hypothetical protein FMEAI12_2260013 [Parafrankia sp. Ea1.12]
MRAHLTGPRKMISSRPGNVRLDPLERVVPNMPGYDRHRAHPRHLTTGRPDPSMRVYLTTQQCRRR